MSQLLQDWQLRRMVGKKTIEEFAAEIEKGREFFESFCEGLSAFIVKAEEWFGPEKLESVVSVRNETYATDTIPGGPNGMFNHKLPRWENSLYESLSTFRAVPDLGQMLVEIINKIRAFRGFGPIFLRRSAFS